MQPTRVIAIFDIGKTNKKLFLFDEDYNILLEKSVQFEETIDEEGFPCENVFELNDWVESSMEELLQMSDVDIKAFNFSAYGASFVHIDENGKPVAPLYNYLKPFSEVLSGRFYAKYGGQTEFSINSASPVLGNLNSGLQLYRLKYERPQLYAKIHHALHLPQYMSFLVTGKPCSDITSIGCHTALWSFPANDYHPWVYEEGIIDKLAPIFPSDELMTVTYKNTVIKSGVGLHDSSAALIPYLASFTEPFLLISTGTWCISLNPFNQTAIAPEELQQDCLCYMEYRGKPVKASRLFAGYDHELETKALAAHFKLPADYYTQVKPDPELLRKLAAASVPIKETGSHMNGLKSSIAGRRALSQFRSYEEAYHHFMVDLVKEQVVSANLVLHNSPVKSIYVDGGFSKNPLYMQLLAASYPDQQVYAASVSQASALGAALAIHSKWTDRPYPEHAISLKLFEGSNSVAT